MTITELGSIGEFLGSIIVLLTLAYIALQTRQNRIASEMEASRILVADFNLIWGDLADERFSRLMRIGLNDWNALSNNDQSRVHSFFTRLLLHWVGALDQSERSPELTAFVVGWENNILGLILCPGGRQWFDAVKSLYNEDQVGKLESRLSDTETLPPSWIDVAEWNRLDSQDRVEGPVAK